MNLRHTRFLAPVAMVAALAGAAHADVARPVLNAAPGCEGGVSTAYTTGYLDGVEAVKAQLAQATAQMQTQVQAQLNAQLAQIQAQTAAELDTRIAAAQDEALADQAQGARMPSLSGTIRALDAREGADQADPTSLPPGTTITIHDPQDLPPDLYRALMRYVGQ